MRKFFYMATMFVALAALAVGVDAGAMTQSGNTYQTTVQVPGQGDDCDDLSVQVTYDSSTQTVGFQHTGGVTHQSVTGTTQVHVSSGSSSPASTANGQTGVAPHAAGASGVALPLTMAKALTGGTADASSTGTVTYTFRKDDCLYTVKLTVNFDKNGNVTSATTTP